MAGIGFELRRMMDRKGDMMSKLRGYASAGLISAGPWVMAIVTLSIVSVVAPLFVDRPDYNLFRALITYSFAFSLIAVGLVQMSFTRRIADLLFSKHYDRILPAFATACVYVAGGQVLIGTVFCVVADLPVGIALVAVILYVVVSLTWLALIWLGATKDYDAVLWAYAKGSLVSLLAMLIFCVDGFGLDRYGFDHATGLLLGYTLGQALTLFLLVRSITSSMDAGGLPDRSILESLRTYPRLAAVGFVYNAAIWLDQIIFWFSSGEQVHTAIYFHPLYDTCRFFAYLTVIPALAVNLVRVETAFYDRYRAFYGSILHDFPLEQIQERKQWMLESLREGTVRLLRIQGAATFVILLLAPQIIAFLKLPPEAVAVFRACCLGAFFHVLLLITILVQLYFDLRAVALLTCTAFFVTNGALGFWSHSAGIETYGIGYAVAALVSLVFGYYLLERKTARLEFLTFTNQPAAPVEKKVPEPA